MLNKQTQLKLTELIQDQFNDLDILREKPFTFKNGKLILIVKPVLFKEHDLFLKDMASLVFDFYDIFVNIDFLNSYNYKNSDAINIIIEKVSIFTADKKYRRFKIEAWKFIEKWAFVSKKKEIIIPKHNKRLCRKFLNNTEPSEFIYILFLLFVMNFDVVKKNLVEFLKLFRSNIVIDSTIQTDTSSLGSSEKAVVMPKYSDKPFSKQTLQLLEEQSRIK